MGFGFVPSIRNRFWALPRSQIAGQAAAEPTAPRLVKWVESIVWEFVSRLPKLCKQGVQSDSLCLASQGKVR